MGKLCGSYNLFFKPLSRKRAQITAYIITGILILAIISIAILFRNYLEEDPVDKPLVDVVEFVGIDTALRSCLEKVSADALLTVGRQGLHYNMSNLTQVRDTTLWLYKTINIMPSSFSFIESELKDYVEDNYPLCVPLIEYEREGYNILDYNPVVDVEINANSTSFVIDLGLVVVKDGVSKSFEKFSYEYDLNFNKLYLVLSDFINNQLLRPDFDFENPLEDFSVKTDSSFLQFFDFNDVSFAYRFSYVEINKSILKFTIEDLSGALLEGNTFKVSFAANFDTNDIPRYYGVNSVQLISAERLAMLYFPDGSPFDISVRAYFTDSVTRKQTTVRKSEDVEVEWADSDFVTPYPIYRYGPNGAKFDEYVPFYLYQDEQYKYDGSQKGILWNGRYGWLPLNSELSFGGDYLSTSIGGFSEFTTFPCSEIAKQTYVVEKKYDRGFGVPILEDIVWIIIDWWDFIFEWFVFGRIFKMMGFGGTQDGYISNLILGWNFQIENTIEFTAFCDGPIKIQKSCSGGDCSCMFNDITESANPDFEEYYPELKEGETFTPYETNSSAKHSVEYGHIYTVTTSADKFDFGETVLSAKCTVTGPITTTTRHLSQPDIAIEEYLDEPADLVLPPPGNYVGSTVDSSVYNLAEPFIGGLVNLLEKNFKSDFVYADNLNDKFNLGCCVANDGFCLENYYGPYCSGKIEKHSCVDVVNCVDYFNYSEHFNNLKNSEFMPTGSECTYLYGSTIPDLDIYFAGFNYNQSSKFLGDVSSLVVQLMDRSNLGNINFYRVDKFFDLNFTSSIMDFSDDECMGVAPKHLLVTMYGDGSFAGCNQTLNFVDTTSTIKFKEELRKAKSIEFYDSFCEYTDDYSEFTPPVVEIKNIEVLGESAKITFRVDDEQENVSYVIYYKDGSFGDAAGYPVTGIEKIVPTGVDVNVEVFYLNVPGETIYYLMVRDLRGQVAESNEWSVITDGLSLDLSPISTLDVSSSGEEYSFKGYVTSFNAGGISKWSFTSLDESCLTLSQTNLRDGWVTLISESPGCIADLEVYVKSDFDFDASDIIQVKFE